jgi:hypothetical protein
MLNSGKWNPKIPHLLEKIARKTQKRMKTKR